MHNFFLLKFGWGQAKQRQIYMELCKNIYLYLKEEDEKDEDDKNENDTLQGDPEACEDQIISLIGRTRTKPMFNGKK